MYIESTNSTNSLMRELVAQGQWPEGERYLRADYQTAGRGQAGNGWESEPRKNLLCSILFTPRTMPHNTTPFYLNVVVSVAVQRLMEDYLTIKWPNDIYFKDKKIAGILIENTIIGGEVQYSIAGIGFNVNQTIWLSDAPNPTSLKKVTATEWNIDKIMDVLLRELDAVLAMPEPAVWDYYKAHLYRREGFWPFVEREVSIAPTMNAKADADVFWARIKDVLPTGEILLEDQQGEQRKYHFKQIRYVIS